MTSEDDVIRLTGFPMSHRDESGVSKGTKNADA